MYMAWWRGKNTGRVMHAGEERRNFYDYIVYCQSSEFCILESCEFAGSISFAARTHVVVCFRWNVRSRTGGAVALATALLRVTEQAPVRENRERVPGRRWVMSAEDARVVAGAAVVAPAINGRDPLVPASLLSNHNEGTFHIIYLRSVHFAASDKYLSNYFFFISEIKKEKRVRGGKIPGRIVLGMEIGRREWEIFGKFNKFSFVDRLFLEKRCFLISISGN